MPAELVVQIIKDFPVEELVRLTSMRLTHLVSKHSGNDADALWSYQVDRKFRDIIKCADVLQYRIQLQIARALDGDSMRFSLDKRLARLRAWRAGWRTLQGLENTLIPRRNCSTVHCWGSHMSQASYNDRGITLCSLPSKQRGITTWSRSFEDLGFEIATHYYDPSQGLLVATENVYVRSSTDLSSLRILKECTRDDTDDDDYHVKIHLLSDVNGERHPAASLSFIRLDIPGAIEGDTHIAVSGELLALVERVQRSLGPDGKNVLHVFNWKSGRLLKVCGSTLQQTNILIFPRLWRVSSSGTSHSWMIATFWSLQNLMGARIPVSLF